MARDRLDRIAARQQLEQRVDDAAVVFVGDEGDPQPQLCFGTTVQAMLNCQ